MRGGYQELTANGLMTLDELGEKLGQLERDRATAERELEAVKGRQERIEQLRHDKDAFLESYSTMAPEALDGLAPEERHEVYKMLRLKAVIHPGARLEVRGALADLHRVCAHETLSRWRRSRTVRRRPGSGAL